MQSYRVFWLIHMIILTFPLYNTLISLLEVSSDHIKSSMIIDNGVLAFYRLQCTICKCGLLFCLLDRKFQFFLIYLKSLFRIIRNILFIKKNHNFLRIALFVNVVKVALLDDITHGMPVYMASTLLSSLQLLLCKGQKYLQQSVLKYLKVF